VPWDMAADLPSILYFHNHPFLSLSFSHSYCINLNKVNGSPLCLFFPSQKLYQVPFPAHGSLTGVILFFLLGDFFFDMHIEVY
jgi:hypothetical protein